MVDFISRSLNCAASAGEANIWPPGGPYPAPKCTSTWLTIAAACSALRFIATAGLTAFFAAFFFLLFGLTGYLQWTERRGDEKRIQETSVGRNASARGLRAQGSSRLVGRGLRH